MLLLLSPLVFAQELACEPVGVDTLEEHLAGAEGALSTMDRVAAAPLLDQATEAARCLDAPIPRPLLGELAWARAEIAASEMDEELAWTWIRLAQDAGVSEPPKRLPETHPLRRVAADPPDLVPMSGPKGVALFVPKKGAVYADGSAISEPSLRVSTPHLLQTFDKDGAPYLGSWQNGAVFPSAMLVPLVAQGRRERRTAEAGDELPPRNWKPQKLQTEAAYREWIKKHPEGPWLLDAADGIDDLHWTAAQELGTELAMRQYIHDHLDGLHVDQAEFFIENLQYRTLIEDPNRDAWLSFLETYPDGTYGNEARVQVDLLDWEEARKADTAGSYRSYLDKQPKGRNRDLAAVREEERAIDEALSSGLDSALEAFLERWPDGEFADAARAVLGSVEFQAIALKIEGDVPAHVVQKIEADLVAELEKRGVPLLQPDGDASQAASLSIAVELEPAGQITRLRSTMVLSFGALVRPLNTLHIDSQMLPNADAGALFGQMLVASLRPFDRWHTAPPEEASKTQNVVVPSE